MRPQRSREPGPARVELRRLRARRLGGRSVEEGHGDEALPKGSKYVHIYIHIDRYRYVFIYMYVYPYINRYIYMYVYMAL